MKRCNKCGRDLSDDSEFCSYCGCQDLSKILRTSLMCKKCNQELPYDSVFCQYCGNNVLYKQIIVDDNNQYSKIEETYKRDRKPINKSAVIIIMLVSIIVLLFCLIFLKINTNSIQNTSSSNSNLSAEERKLIEEANSKYK